MSWSTSQIEPELELGPEPESESEHEPEPESKPEPEHKTDPLAFYLRGRRLGEVPRDPPSPSYKFDIIGS